jgi:hypothetical protein
MPAGPSPRKIGPTLEETEAWEMKAQVGDRLVVGPRRVGLPRRRAEIVEVLGKDGTAPFRIRWPEDDRVSLVAELGYARRARRRGRRAARSPQLGGADR